MSRPFWMIIRMLNTMVKICESSLSNCIHEISLAIKQPMFTPFNFLIKDSNRKTSVKNVKLLLDFICLSTYCRLPFSSGIIMMIIIVTMIKIIMTMMIMMIIMIMVVMVATAAANNNGNGSNNNKNDDGDGNNENNDTNQLLMAFRWCFSRC